MMPVPRRVVLTGIGLVCPLGNTKEALWDALITGRSGIGKFDSVPTQNLPMSFAAEARGFTGDVDEFGPLEKEQKKAIRKALKVMCREIQMGVAAAQLAIQRRSADPGQFSSGTDRLCFWGGLHADDARGVFGGYRQML